MHQGDGPVVANQIKVRDVASRILHPHRNEEHRNPFPDQADENLDVKIHSAAEAMIRLELRHTLERIETQAAHRIYWMLRKRFDPDPEVRDRAADASSPRHRRIVNGRARNQRIGMCLAERDELRQVRKIVLSISVDLQRMSKSRRAREIEALHHRGAFAAIGVEAMHDHFILGRMKCG